MSFSLLADERLDANALLEIEADIAEVELELAKQIRSQIKLVTTVGSHVLHAGGKRLRPAFLALSARACCRPYTPERAYKLAACMEMIHMATLIHDDVIDHAETRRGRATASSVYGNTASILSGDVLLSKAMSILAEDGDLAIIRSVSSSVVDLAEGEVREMETRNRFDLSEGEYFEILRRKTASFIRCCCEVGARIAGTEDSVRAALGDYGHHIGLAFQVVDDLLDYAGDKKVTGKPRATDFREGCSTLPLILLLPNLSKAERETAEAKFGNGVTEDEIKMICQWMESRGAFEKAEAVAKRHVALAKQSLAPVPESFGRTLLEVAADFVIQRKS